jgi:hypothetical protein
MGCVAEGMDERGCRTGLREPLEVSMLYTCCRAPGGVHVRDDLQRSDLGAKHVDFTLQTLKIRARGQRPGQGRRVATAEPALSPLVRK